MFENERELISSTRFKKATGWSNKVYYRMVKQPGFPSVLIGEKYYVIKAGFIKWLEEQSKLEKAI